MKIWIHAGNDSKIEYIVDSDSIIETAKAIGLPLGRNGQYPIIDRRYFSLKLVSVTPLNNFKTKIVVPEWMLKKEPLPQGLRNRARILGDLSPR